MRETSSSTIRTDLAHPAPDPISQRKAVLATEARRLVRRRAVALAVAARCRRIATQAIQPEIAETVAGRAMRRATVLHVRFHRTLDALVAAGGFDDALKIVRDRK
ncbi:MAG: hypothetical protein JWN86_3762 [Planctomycetota bacterium]|nr:hypothetical protein [Planctomycetota bacterium]